MSSFKFFSCPHLIFSCPHLSFFMSSFGFFMSSFESADNVPTSLKNPENKLKTSIIKTSIKTSYQGSDFFKNFFGKIFA